MELIQTFLPSYIGVEFSGHLFSFKNTGKLLIHYINNIKEIDKAILCNLPSLLCYSCTKLTCQLLVRKLVNLLSIFLEYTLLKSKNNEFSKKFLQIDLLHFYEDKSIPLRSCFKEPYCPILQLRSYGKD